MWLAALAVVGGVFLRMYHLGEPAKPIFDEVYFPVFAAKLLHGELAFDVHPPLGKMLMAIGIWLFGDRSFGWRFIPCLFGILLIGVFAGTWRSLAAARPEAGEKEELTVGTWLIAAMAALEGTLILYSRVGLMDGVLLAFILLSLWLVARAKRGRDLPAVAMVIGLAVSIKWLALAALLPVSYVAWRRKLFGQFLLSLPLGIAVYLLVVLGGEWISGAEHPWSALVEWHRQAWLYHLDLQATHPWSSMWWSWPIMQRPLLMFYETTANGDLQVMTAIGNPALWWGGTLAIIGSVGYLFWQWFGRLRSIVDHPLVPIVLGYFAFWLAWIPIKRVLFIYHYLPSYAFGLLALNYWLIWLWRRRPALVIGFLVLAIGLTVFFAPLATGWPISKLWLDRHIWFSSWM